MDLGPRRSYAAAFQGAPEPAATRPRGASAETNVCRARRSRSGSRIPVEPDIKAVRRTSARSSLIILQQHVKAPDKFAQRFNMSHLVRRYRHQPVQWAFGMDPAQRMGANPKLSGIVGGDHRIADQTRMAAGTHDTCLGKRADNVLVVMSMPCSAR